MKINEKKYYDKKKNWNFNNFDIISEKLTDWDMYDILNNLSNENSILISKYEKLPDNYKNHVNGYIDGLLDKNK